jgi:hypothetical protein
MFKVQGEKCSKFDVSRKAGSRNNILNVEAGQGSMLEEGEGNIEHRTLNLEHSLHIAH